MSEDGTESVSAPVDGAELIFDKRYPGAHRIIVDTEREHGQRERTIVRVWRIRDSHVDGECENPT